MSEQCYECSNVFFMWICTSFDFSPWKGYIVPTNSSYLLWSNFDHQENSCMIRGQDMLVNWKWTRLRLLLEDGCKQGGLIEGKVLSHMLTHPIYHNEIQLSRPKKIVSRTFNISHLKPWLDEPIYSFHKSVTIHCADTFVVDSKLPDICPAIWT